MMDKIEEFQADLADLEQTFYWWWHKMPEEIEAANALLGLAEALQDRVTKSKDLPLKERRRLLRSAFMIHEMVMCFDGSGMREKLPN
jgi:hypothetical protein